MLYIYIDRKKTVSINSHQALNRHTVIVPVSMVIHMIHVLCLLDCQLPDGLCHMLRHWNSVLSHHAVCELLFLLLPPVWPMWREEAAKDLESCPLQEDLLRCGIDDNNTHHGVSTGT